MCRCHERLCVLATPHVRRRNHRAMERPADARRMPAPALRRVRASRWSSRRRRCGGERRRRTAPRGLGQKETRRREMDCGERPELGRGRARPMAAPVARRGRRARSSKGRSAALRTAPPPIRLATRSISIRVTTLDIAPSRTTIARGGPWSRKNPQCSSAQRPACRPLPPSATPGCSTSADSTTRDRSIGGRNDHIICSADEP